MAINGLHLQQLHLSVRHRHTHTEIFLQTLLVLNKYFNLSTLTQGLKYRTTGQNLNLGREPQKKKKKKKKKKIPMSVAT